MYTFSSKLKTLSFILMAIGLIGIGIGFSNAPKNIEEVEKILASEGHGHKAAHAEKAVAAHPAAEGHVAHAATEVNAHAEHEAHLEHVLHQLQNKPWAAL